MAIIQCPKCQSGIQYHGIPDGTEFVAVSIADWDNILSSFFDPNQKKIHDDTGHPYLYRSDTIETDFPRAVHKGWKCPDCGSILIFTEGGFLSEAYEKSEVSDSVTADSVVPAEEYIVFDDYTWDSLTEAAIPNQMISKVFTKTGSASVSSDQSACAYVSDNGDICIYRSIKPIREVPM